MNSNKNMETSHFIKRKQLMREIRHQDNKKKGKALQKKKKKKKLRFSGKNSKELGRPKIKEKRLRFSSHLQRWPATGEITKERKAKGEMKQPFDSP